MKDEVFDSHQPPQIPDTSLAGSIHSHKFTFRNQVAKKGSVSSIPCLIHQPVSFNLSEIPEPETSDKDTDREGERVQNPNIRSRLAAYLQCRRTKQDTFHAMHSLQLAPDEFKRIHEPKMAKLMINTQLMPC